MAAYLFDSGRSVRFYSTVMKEQEILDNLEELAGKLGIDIRYDLLDSKGGFCRYLDGETMKPVFIINKALPAHEKNRILATQLARFPLEDIYTLPYIRDLISEYHRERTSAAAAGTVDESHGQN
ncbi:hypothetical protein ACFLT7_05450 [candidate division KSB1 bacterium]